MSGVGTVFRAPFVPSLDLGNASSATLFKGSNGATAALNLQTDNQFTNRRFILNLAGRVATSSNLTFTINIYLGTTGTTADKLIFASGANTVNTKKTNWHIDLSMFWDSDAQIINGIGSGQIDNNPIGAAGLAGVLALDPNLHNTSNSFQGVFNKFTVTGTFSGSSAGNHAFIDIFEVTLQ